MLRATLRGLRRRLGQGETFAIISGHPEEVEHVHGVPGIHWLDFPAIYRAMASADLFLSGGGSLLQDATSFRNLAYHLTLFWIARRSRTNAMVFAQGVGPIRSRLGRNLTRRILQSLAAVTVRDPASAELLADLGLTVPTVEVTADPAFAIDPCPEPRVEEILRSEGLGRGSRPLVALAPRGLRHREAEAESLAFLADWAARKLRVTPLLVPMQFPDDLPACDMILARMKHAGEAAVVGQPLAPEEVLGVIRRCEIVVGVRLHALIFAAAMGVPLIGVEYDPKVRYFLKTLGVAPVVDLANLPAARQDLVLGFERAWKDREGLRRHLERVVPELRSLAERNFDVAAAVALRGKVRMK